MGGSKTVAANPSHPALQQSPTDGGKAVEFSDMRPKDDRKIQMAAVVKCQSIVPHDDAIRKISGESDTVEHV